VSVNEQNFIYLALQKISLRSVDGIRRKKMPAQLRPSLRVA
jgi:hypothetical protein